MSTAKHDRYCLHLPMLKPVCYNAQSIDLAHAEVEVASARFCLGCQGEADSQHVACVP